MAILSCEALSKTYASGETAVHAVQEISLAFEQGSFTAITGPSGSGKSTLLHMLGALEYPTGGKVFFQNADLFAYNDNQLPVRLCVPGIQPGARADGLREHPAARDAR